MLARNPGNVLLISTATHDVLEYHVPGGFHGLYLFRGSPLMAALTGKGLMLWETEKGTALDTVTIPEPVLLLEPPPAQPQAQGALELKPKSERIGS
jgi:hypothetical protein